jgi:hypothetical protein
MKVFWCDNCGQFIFFENSQCMSCLCNLAFVPDRTDLKSYFAKDVDPKSGTFEGDGRWRPCANYLNHNVCNWAVAANDPNPLCISCRLTRVIPDLKVPANVVAWFKLEQAKRRLIYTLRDLKLPVDGKKNPTDATGLTFEFLADPPPGGPPILTGHTNGLITISLAEADDAERERRRTLLREPYRTLLGHLRHEIGHYYWDRLVAPGSRIEKFRSLFGDERPDYDAALHRHYTNGPPRDWQNRFVSSYASCHPWEDWAESWAHYLHMWEVMETAGYAGLRLRPKMPDAPAVKIQPPLEVSQMSFDQMIADWIPLTYVINNLNRGLGLADGYPFVLSVSAIEKLRFIHDTIAAGVPGDSSSKTSLTEPRVTSNKATTATAG